MEESQYKLAEYMSALFKDKRLKDDYVVEDVILLVIQDLKAINNKVKEL